MNRRNFIQSVGAACLVSVAPIAVWASELHTTVTIEELQKEIQDSLLKYVFEPNDQMTRDMVANDLRIIFARHNVYDHSVICDETNNTPDRLDRHGLIADVAIKLTEADEFVYMPVRIVPI